MRFFLSLVLLAAALLAGCSPQPAPPDPADRLLGVWQLDVPYTEDKWATAKDARLSEDASPEQIKAFAEDLVQETAVLTIAESAYFLFTEQELVIIGNGEAQRIPYQVLEQPTGEQVRVRFEDTTEVLYEFVDGNHLKVPFMADKGKYLYMVPSEEQDQATEEIIEKLRLQDRPAPEEVVDEDITIEMDPAVERKIREQMNSEAAQQDKNARDAPMPEQLLEAPFAE